MASSSAAITGDIYEEQEGNLPVRAEFNEVGRFQGRLREEDSIVRHDAHRVPMDVSKAL
jgi:hypothetical protein